MRWMPFFFLLVIALPLQSVVAPKVEVLGARPDLLLILTLFLALYAPADQAVIGAWLIGFCADGLTIERFGLMSLSYGLIGLLVVSAREYLFRFHILTRVAVAFIACVLVRCNWALYSMLRYPDARVLSELLSLTIGSAAYTAALAGPIQGGLLRIARAVGLPRSVVEQREGTEWSNARV